MQRNKPADFWLDYFVDVERQMKARILAVKGDVSTDIANYQEKVDEDKITDFLANRLETDEIVRKIGRIETQKRILNYRGIGDIGVRGYIDFVLFFRKNLDRYLAYECKMLNVTKKQFSSRAGRYVDDGVRRFSSAQYVEEQPVGVMLGYVRDGNVQSAANSVVSALMKRHRILGWDHKIMHLETQKNVLEHFETDHWREVPDEPISVRHVLIAI
jgi:hypothetical protein